MGKRWRTVVFGMTALLIMGTAWITWNVIYMVRDMYQLRSELYHIRALVREADRQETDLSRLIELTGRLETHLYRARVAAGSGNDHLNRVRPLFIIARYLPGDAFGSGEVPDLLQMTRQGLDGAVRANRILRVFLMSADSTSDVPVSMRMARLINEYQDQFPVLADDLQGTLAARQQVCTTCLSGPLSEVRSILSDFDAYMPEVERMSQGMRLLPDASTALLGLDGPRTYALLAQNAAELRPTGGFIGTIGLLHVEQGQIDMIDMKSSYFFDNEELGLSPAPEPFANHLGFTGWSVRDSNWSPDFPSAARTAAEMLSYYADTEVDGVIGITTRAVDMLLRVIGPVQSTALDEPLTAQNFIRLLEDEMYGDDPAIRIPTEQKQLNKGKVLRPVVEEVMDRLAQLPATENLVVLRTLRRMLRERELMGYFYDASAQELAELIGASGAYRSDPTHRAVGVVDANLSYSKSSLFIKRQIVHEFWLNSDGQVTRARVTVTYDHTMSMDPRQWYGRLGAGTEWEPRVRKLVLRPGIFGTYTRVYVPQGSHLIKSGVTGNAAGYPNDSVDVTSELGMTVFGRSYSLLPGGQLQAWLEYQPPPAAFGAEGFGLSLLRQPGTLPPAVTVRVYVPPSLRVRDLRGFTHQGEMLTYEGVLDRDRQVGFQFSPATAR